MSGTDLAWIAGDGVASWAMEGLERVGLAGSARASAIRFAIADGRTVATSDGRPLPVSIRATAGATSVALPLAHFGDVPPPLPVQLAKHDLLVAAAGIDLSVRSTSEIVLQTYEIPLAAFAAADPAFEPVGLTAFSIDVPRTADGALWIAEPALVP
jgi:hypothetical protein